MKRIIKATTKLKRISSYNEFDNGHVLHNWVEMTDEEAEEAARKASLKDPTNVYYVAYDDLMDSSSDICWINGKSYSSTEGYKFYIENIKNKTNISSAEYVDNKDNTDDIEILDQEFTSENTSINSTKLPAIFKMVSFAPNTINLDYGGGKFDNVAEYLAETYDATNLVYDPYNRDAKHNSAVLQQIRANGGADTATCSNVLNVIKEPEVRLNVLNNIKKLLKPNGTVYITVYEGTGKGNEGATKSGYQLNRKTADYIDEIQQVFPDAKRKGKLIIATNTGNSENIESSTNVLGQYSSFQDPLLEPPESDWIDVPDHSETLEVDIDAIIIVDNDGDYEWEDTDYNWAKPDDEYSTVWRSEEGVNLGDEIDIVEHIDELLVEDMPLVKSGRYRVTGTAKLDFYLSGLWIDDEGNNFAEEADAMFYPKDSSIENLKVSPIK